MKHLREIRSGLSIILGGLLLAGCATQSTVQSRKQERAAGYAALTSEFQKLADDGEIRRGMSEDGVYIAWGKPAQILKQEDAQGARMIWLYEGGWMEETRYWTGRHRGRLEHDYQPRTYVRAEIVFVNGVVESWRSLPQPTY